jgi:hypothetical protein
VGEHDVAATVFVVMITVVGMLGWLVRTAVDYRRGAGSPKSAEAHQAFGSVHRQRNFLA